MKLLAIFFTAIILSIIVTTSVLAAPFKAAEQNPNVVVYYEDGPHGIVGEPYYHEGQDLVMKAGESGVFQQWFYGYSEEDGGVIEGDHSVLKLAKDGCPDGWVLVEDINTSPDKYWGDYLEYGADYCVKTNDFKAPGHQGI